MSLTFSGQICCALANCKCSWWRHAKTHLTDNNDNKPNHFVSHKRINSIDEMTIFFHVLFLCTSYSNRSEKILIYTIFFFFISFHLTMKITCIDVANMKILWHLSYLNIDVSVYNSLFFLLLSSLEEYSLHIHYKCIDSIIKK